MNAYYLTGKSLLNCEKLLHKIMLFFRWLAHMSMKLIPNVKWITSEKVKMCSKCKVLAMEDLMVKKKKIGPLEGKGPHI